MPEGPPTVLTWAASIAGFSGRTAAVHDLSQPGSNGPWALELERGEPVAGVVVHVLGGADAPDDVAQCLHLQLAALESALAAGLPVPAVLAVDPNGESSGWVAMVQEWIAGSSSIPVEPDGRRMRALGRVAAGIHAVTVAEDAQLPPRVRSIGDVDFRRFGPADGDDSRSAALYRAAFDYVDAHPCAPPARSLTHGDLWQGNVTWSGDTVSGVLDWDEAGVGAAGIDIGSLRMDIAVMYGVRWSDEVSAGWREATGAPVADAPYWDLVAVTSSPFDLGMWLPNFHHHGRVDLDLQTVTARRDVLVDNAFRLLGA
jgi:hypothetical protein